MPTYYSTVSLPYQSGLPQDVTQFGMCMVAGAVVDIADVIQQLEAFFMNPWDTETLSLGNLYSPVVQRGTTSGTLTTYLLDLATGSLGEPLDISNFAFTDQSSTSSALPEEVALCSSYRAISASTPRRGKGRIYLGPFNASVSTTASGISRPGPELRNNAAGCVERMRQNLQTAGIQWCVWSRADAAAYPITSGWVDNAWDTQRRRGSGADARLQWTTV